MKINSLIYSFIIAIIFFVSKIILNSFDIDYMYSIRQVFYFAIYVTAVIGFIQLSKDNKLMLTITILIIIVISFFIGVFAILSSKEIRITYVEKEKVVKEIYGIPDPMEYTYKYINSFFKSYKTINLPIQQPKTNEYKEDTILKFYNKNNSFNPKSHYYMD